MKFRRIAASAAVAALTLTLAPTTAAAGTPGPDRAPRDTGASASPTTRPQPVEPDDHTDPALLRRKTDTLSLYKQAGMTPPKRLRTERATRVNAAYNGPVSAAATGPNIITGLQDHVDQSCTGTGTDGARVQAMYVREVDMVDRYAEVAPLLRNEMRLVDDVFALSSMATGGGRRVRWVTDPNCSLSVLNVVLPDGAITGGFGKTENALRDAGYLTTQRKYLAFADVAAGGMGVAHGTSSCGLGTVLMDSSPTNNLNDGRIPQMARMDRECWITGNPDQPSVALHELGHTLGAVQTDSPNTYMSGHCSDGADVMCYVDSTKPTPTCPTTQAALLDCNKDDYFNTNPAPGSYLDTHWNIANSPFLNTVAPLPTPPAISVTPSTSVPEAGDLVTFTANVAAGTTVNWSVDAAECETGAAKTGTTFQIRCFNQSEPTVTATASNTGLTVRYAKTPISYKPGPSPVLELTAPASVAAGTPFQVTANITNAKSPWTYRWNLRTAGCTSSNGLTATTLNATCNTSAVGENAAFTVTATRTGDGAVYTNSIGVNITSPGTPTVTISGPTAVVAGQPATFAATVTNAKSPTYQWSSTQGWGNGSATGSTYTTVPTATVQYGSDVVYLTVRTSDGQQVTTSFIYDVEGALAVTLSGPAKLTPGATGKFTASTSKDATLGWSDNQPACTVVKDPANQTVGRLTCDATFVGTVSVSVEARTGTETVVKSKSVTVSNTPVVSAVGTTLAFTASKKGYPTFMMITLTTTTGKAVPNRMVQLERRVGTGSYQQVMAIQLNTAGEATFDLPVTEGATYRVQFYGDAGYTKSVSAERRVDLYTRLGNTRTKAGLKAKLQTGWGKGIAQQKVILQKNVVGTKKWATVKSYTTNRSGVVKVKMNPRKATDYRWKFKRSTTYAASRSAKVRLR